MESSCTKRSAQETGQRRKPLTPLMNCSTIPKNMPNQFAVIACVIAASFFLMLSPAYAHGDHKDQAVSPEPAQSLGSTDNIYSAEDKTASPDTDLPLSRM